MIEPNFKQCDGGIKTKLWFSWCFLIVVVLTTTTNLHVVWNKYLQSTIYDPIPTFPKVKVSTRQAVECLRYTKASITDMVYPNDAFQHYHHIHHRLGEWLQHSNHRPHRNAGYSGPWIENRWISYFQNELESKNYSMEDVFGPYIPIFVPWTDIWLAETGEGGRKGRKRKRWTYTKEFITVMKDLLREDVLYITVNQNDDGFVGRCSEFEELQEKYHITVLSAGGYGHVPIPLLKQFEPTISKIPTGERKELVSYVGSNKNAPNEMRQRMIDQGNHRYYYGENWRSVMADSKFSLCPRGFGRTSYHIMETLQMGLIPIQVYIDQPWLPYANLLKNITYAVRVEELPTLISKLSNMSDSEHAEIEKRIESLKDDYFTMEGTLMQIGKFMMNPETSDLVCQALPSDSGSPQSGTHQCA